VNVRDGDLADVRCMVHPPLVRRLSILVFAALVGCAPRPSGTREGSAPPPVILVSIDGFRPDYLGRGNSPTLDSIAEAGVRAEWMEPSFPSKTFPNHYTIVTGLRPDHHGIIANNIRDSALGRFSMGDRDAVRDARWWGGEPIWATLAKAGGVAAPIFWPGSEAPIGGALPAIWEAFDEDVSPNDRVDNLLALLERSGAMRPEFLTLYTSVVDHAGHTFGPTSSELANAVSVADAMVARLAAGLHARGLADRVNLIIVSDHGMSSTSSDRLIVLDDLIDLDDIVVHDWGPVGQYQPVEGKSELVYQALHDRHPALTVYRREELPARLAFGSHPRVPEIVAIAADGWRITTRRQVADFRPGGDHGYDNALPSMRALFLASGPGFRQGSVVPSFSNIHVYSLMAHLLGLQPAPNDGSLDSVRVMLRVDDRR
jgi:predicted AlkP superfamily pyrophosphatase or phosphodiesterase